MCEISSSKSISPESLHVLFMLTKCKDLTQINPEKSQESLARVSQDISQDKSTNRTPFLTTDPSSNPQ